VTGVELTACLLARIFSRDIKTWDHADIMAANPKLIVPAGEPILVYHRVLGSSTTGGIHTHHDRHSLTL
jgi:ABC-type phosphate transport system substrate-binding protein